MTESAEIKICPGCGEPVQETWRFCPGCEISLESLICNRCSLEVEAKWKICPECGTRLLCRSCGRRIPKDLPECPAYTGGEQGQPVPEKTLIEPVTRMEFIHIPASRFMMGDTTGEGMDDEQPVHEVFLDGYYMGKHPVTQAEWTRIQKENPSHFQGDPLPVESVTLDEVQAFIQALTQAGPDSHRFSLPTEAQWEYAARSGGREELYPGSDVADSVAWYGDNSGGSTRPVATKAPNGLGIYDMSGNVWEWCLDIYRSDAYRLHDRQNPVCSDGEENHVIRGGSWNIDAWSIRCTRRFKFSKNFSAPGLGFRLVMLI